MLREQKLCPQEFDAIYEELDQTLGQHHLLLKRCSSHPRPLQALGVPVVQLHFLALRRSVFLFKEPK